MTQTFTSPPEITASQIEQEQKPELLSFAEPSQQTVQNILNYSKNLEIKQSKMLIEVEFVKS